jgi:hypothetical protein
MPRTCKVCNHPEREPIERALVNGEPYRSIAARYGTSTTSLHRHRVDHLAAGIARAHEAHTVARADNLLEEVRRGADRTERLYGAIEVILQRALKAGDLKTALQAIKTGADVMREERGYLELRGEITGELGQHPGQEPRQGLTPDGRQIVNVVLLPKEPGVEGSGAGTILEIGPGVRRKW